MSKKQHSAMRRAVGIVAAFGTAAATAVIVAPAASAAWAGSHDSIVRATPLADAAYVDSGGQATGSAGFATYGAAHATGFARLVGQGSARQVSNFQIKLASATGAGGNWAAADAITVTLPAGVTFTAPPVVATDGVLVDMATLAGAAGFAGTHATKATPAGSGTSLTASAVGAPTVAGGTLTIPMTAADPGNNPANSGYLLSASGVSVTVPTSFTGPITATVAMPSGSHNATTLGYVAPLTVTAPATTVAPGSGSQQLPAITIGELVNSGLSAGSYTLTVTGASFDITKPAAVTAAGPSGIWIAASPVTPTASAVSFTVTTPSASAQESVTVTGLHITGVTSGTPVTVALTTGGFASNNGLGSTFSYVPALAAPAVSFTTGLPRTAGSSRYDTAARIAADYAALPGFGKDAVILANGENAGQGIDALAANYLAGAKHAPILLTAATSLDSDTQAALISLFSGGTQDVTLYVMGKSDRISAAVRTQAKNLIQAAIAAGKTVTIQEVAGNSRYATSAETATLAGPGALTLHSLAVGDPYLKTAFLASGTENADALAAGAISYAEGIPMLLTSGAAITPEVASAITTLGIGQVIVLGGTDRVSAATVASLGALGVTSTTRIAGPSRYATAADLYTWAYGNATPSSGDRGLGWTGSTAFLANGTAGFPDALAVGPLAGEQHHAVLTTAAMALSPQASAFLTVHKTTLTGGVWAFGGTDRISDAVIVAALAATH